MTNNGRRLTARQLASALAEIDAQLDALRRVLATFDATFAGGEVPEPVYDAWNATHGAVEALEFRRREVELNPRPSTELSKLVAANID